MAVGNEHRGSSGAPLSADEVVERRLEDWRRRLIDLSHRNRLIAFKPTRATTLRIAARSGDELLADPDRTQPWDFYFRPEVPTSDAEDTSETAATVDRIVLDSRRVHSGRSTNEIEVTEPNPAR